MTAPATAPSEMAFFSPLVRAGSLSAAARELGISTPAVSKRLAQMEARLGVPLMHRTTRRIGLTQEREIYLEQARRRLTDGAHGVTRPTAPPLGRSIRVLCP